MFISVSLLTETIKQKRSRGGILQKVESGMGCPDRHTAMHSLRLQRLLWIYCPGHARVSRNEQADRLANTADTTSGLQFGRAEVLRGLRNFLNMDRPEHHSIDPLKERGVYMGLFECYNAILS